MRVRVRECVSVCVSVCRSLLGYECGVLRVCTCARLRACVCVCVHMSIVCLDIHLCM